jgi:hypothetical protein
VEIEIHRWYWQQKVNTTNIVRPLILHWWKRAHVWTNVPFSVLLELLPGATKIYPRP